MLDQIFGSGLGGGLVGGAIDTGFGDWSSARAHNRSTDAYRRRYQWTVEDLERAGLNPILAVNGGMAGSSPSSAAAIRGGGVTKSGLELQQRKLYNAQTAKTLEEKNSIELQNRLLRMKMPKAEAGEHMFRGINDYLNSAGDYGDYGIATAKKFWHRFRLATENLGRKEKEVVDKVKHYIDVKWND